MRHSLAAAALLVATLCGNTAAHADIKWNGPVLQGLQFNGISLQGARLNGVTLQGISLNGISLQGKMFNGIILQGIQFNGVGANFDVTVATPDIAFTSVPLDRVHVALPAR